MSNKCFSFSFTASRDWCLRFSLSGSGLRSTITDLGDGTVMHCWVPKTRKENRPNLLLLHGLGANAMWQWGDLITRVASHFNIYVPDLVFFGESYSNRPERSDSFQAESVMRLMEANSVKKVRVVGLSYGGFVAYRMAAMYKEAVERVVICCAGVCLEEKDLGDGFFPVKDLEEAVEILLPQTADKMRELLSYTFMKPPLKMPDCLLMDFIDEMCRDNVEEKKELIKALPKDRKLSELPKISQPTLIVWGDQDKIFPVELGYRLKRHLGDNAELVVIKDSGHAYLAEKPREFYKHLKPFLLNSTPPPPPPPPTTTTTTTSTTSTPPVPTLDHQNGK